MENAVCVGPKRANLRDLFQGASRLYSPLLVGARILKATLARLTLVARDDVDTTGVCSVVPALCGFQECGGIPRPIVIVLANSVP